MPPKPSSQPVAILCDFDMTAATTDVIDFIYDHFCGPECQEFRQRWREGLISTPQEIEGCFSSITISTDELKAALNGIELDPAFADLVMWARRKGFEFAIVSDGLEWYIQDILARSGLQNITVYSNQIHFSEAGMRFTYPWFDPKAPRSGTSKGKIIRSYQARPAEVVFIGDGLSDIEASHVADRVYAKDKLLAHCRRSDVPALEFTTLADVLADLKKVYSD